MGLLPKEKTKASTNLLDYTWFFYGEPGFGKTTLACQFPKPLHIVCGENPHHIESYQIELKEYETLLKIEKELEGTHNFKTVVFDTVPAAYQLCEDYVCKKEGFSNSNKSYGLVPTLTEKEFRRFLTALRDMGLCIVFIAHEQKDIIDQPGGEDPITYAQTVGSKRCKQVCLSFSNFIGRFLKEIQADGSRPELNISFVGNKFYEAKNHLPPSLLETFPSKIKINKGKQAIGYEQLEKAFKGELIDT